jgi:arabinofuranosyltransferase
MHRELLSQWKALPRVARIVALFALAIGVLLALAAAWTGDDAFISFRYARNLVEGHGLVFNAGERVEGYTNLLWTLWIALGLQLGFDAQSWSNAWSIAAYGGAICLLVLVHARLRDPLSAGERALPFAALLAATHGDWNHYATSGLETSVFTTLALAGYVVTARSITDGPARPELAAVLLALASLTRPDGVIFGAAAGTAFAFGAPRPLRASLRFALAFALLWVPANVWRVLYYGDLFPNTYYAKSAYLSWFDQGWRYLFLYLEKYWPLLLGPLLAGWAVVRARSTSAPAHRVLVRHLALACAFLLPYTLYVVKVGGDFMYARMLVPVTPYLLILAELGLQPLSRNRPWAHLGIGGAVMLAATAMPRPVTARHWEHGVADEWGVYSPDQAARTDHIAEVLARYFEGLPVRMAFMGAEARVVYHARIPVAIEAATGLTDATIARQELTVRGRPGHEKVAPVPYLVSERRVHFVFNPQARQGLDLDRWIPVGTITLDDVQGWILHWDPELMATLAARGAVFVDFPTALDRYLADLDRVPVEAVAADYERIQRFYFDHVDDLARQRAFEERLR